MSVEQPNQDYKLLASVAELVIAQRAELEGGGSSEVVRRTILEGDPDELVSVGVALLAHEDQQHRILGSRMVREVRGQEVVAIDALLAAFDREGDAAALYWLISALGYTGSERATDRLLLLVDSPDPAIRYAVSDALSSVEELSEAACRALIRLTGDEDSEVRFSAVFELGTWLPQIPELRSVLEAALADPVALVVRTAREALEDYEAVAENPD